MHAVLFYEPFCSFDEVVCHMVRNHGSHCCVDLLDALFCKDDPLYRAQKEIVVFAPAKGIAASSIENISKLSCFNSPRALNSFFLSTSETLEWCVLPWSTQCPDMRAILVITRNPECLRAFAPLKLSDDVGMNGDRRGRIISRYESESDMAGAFHSLSFIPSEAVFLQVGSMLISDLENLLVWSATPPEVLMRNGIDEASLEVVREWSPRYRISDSYKNLYIYRFRSVKPVVSAMNTLLLDAQYAEAWTWITSACQASEELIDLFEHQGEGCPYSRQHSIASLSKEAAWAIAGPPIGVDADCVTFVSSDHSIRRLVWDAVSASEMSADENRWPYEGVLAIL